MKGKEIFLYEGIVLIDSKRILELVNIFERVSSKLVGKFLPTEKIIKILNSSFSSHGVKFMETSEGVTSVTECFIVRATLMSSRTIIIFYRSNGFEKNFVSLSTYQKFVNQIKELVSHESIHIQQLNKAKIGLGFDTFDFKEWLNKKLEQYHNKNLYEEIPEEIRAYAAEYIEYLKNRGLAKQQILDKIRKYRSDPEVSEKFSRYSYQSEIGNRKVYQQFIKFLYLYANQS